MAAGRVVVLRNEDSYRRVSKREFSLSRVGTRRAELVNWHDIGHRASYDDDLVIQPGKGHIGPSRCGFDKVETSCFADVIQLPPQKRRKFSPIFWDGETMAKSSARSEIPENAVSATSSLLEPHTEGSSLGSCDLVYHGSRTHGEISDSTVSFAHLSQEVNEEQDQIAEQFQPPRDISLSRWASDDEPQDDKVNNKDMREAEMPFGRMSMESGEFREVYEADNGSSCSTRSISKADTVECEEQGNGVMQMDDECLSKLKLSSVDPIEGGMESVPCCRHVDEFEKLNRISEGTYGIVYKARNKRMGKFVAMKKVKILNNRDFEEYGFPLTSLREINILASMNHPSIVNIEEVVVDSKDTVFMVMEYMEHDLRGLLDKIKHPFSISEVKSLMFQLLEGVKYLHDNWVLHRDLKTSNILLNSKGELKICDFGMARQYGSPLQPYTTRVVTQFYRAPELLLGAKKYSTAVDMWSVGCIMAELLLTEPLFQGKNEIDQLAKIFRTLGTPNDKLWSGFSQLPGAKAKFSYQPYNLLRKKFPAITFTFTGAASLSESGLDLLNKLLTYDPQKRISAEDALNHSWFKEVPYAETPTFSTRTYS